jgi:hypothetical protein
MRFIVVSIAARQTNRSLSIVALPLRPVGLSPQGIDSIDARCNAGERRVLHQLRRCLEDDYIVWHDIAIRRSGHALGSGVLRLGPCQPGTTAVYLYLGKPF